MRIPTILMVILLLCVAGTASAQSSASYAIAFDVFDSGGGFGAIGGAAPLRAHSIIGQAAQLHTSSAANHIASSGAQCLFCGDFVVGITEPAILPNIMRLFQNYPNPFNPSTTIRYTLDRGGTLELAVYNLLGEKVDVLVSEYQKPGDYSIDYTADALRSGVYLYRLRTEHGQLTRRMVLMK